MTVAQRVKWSVIRVGKRLDAQEGRSRDLVRATLGLLASVIYTFRNRRVTTLSWSRNEQRWCHRWPEGRVHDTRWWRSPELWSQHGGDYDMADLLWRHYRPRAGDVVFDVGAGDGGETFWLTGLVGAEGRVIAVEAAPEPFARLSELVALNRWDNVEPRQVALAGSPGTVSMSDSEDWVAGNVFEGGGAEVQAVTLDDLCAELGVERVDWLKMNIEGSEKDAVLGMERMAPHIRHLTVSCHDFLGTEWGRSKDQVVSWLRDHGFTVAEHGPEGYPAERDYVYAWHEESD
jgi:FkbM family methyltransferase